MGTSAKTLARLMQLHGEGLLPNGGSIIELGAQELYCTSQDALVRDTIKYFARHNLAIRRIESYNEEEIRRFADKGLLGGLLTACGFYYKALDIFEAENTIQFDLNIHSPGPDLTGKFDVVTNFGTTEHLINQFQAIRTMHELAKVGGLIWHELPLSGYHMHGYFSYNPLLFQHLAVANGYRVVIQNYAKSLKETAAPAAMTSNGYPDNGYFDCGVEFCFQKTSDEAFRMPLETSTSLGLNKSLWGDDSPYSSTDSPVYGSLKSDLRLQRELIARFARRVARRLRPS
jgi:hypothetical protein